VEDWLAREIPVQCAGAWHRLGFRRGRLVPLDHDEIDVERERAMRSLGGATPECFEVLGTWRGETSGALPPSLAQFRTHTTALIAHGDTVAIRRLLDAGLKATQLHGPDGGGLLHHLGLLFVGEGSTVDAGALLPRLLAAGADIDERDPDGRTPLLCALLQEGTPDLVSALLAAGADPRLVLAPDGELSTRDWRRTRAHPESRRLVEEAARALGHLDQAAIDDHAAYRRRFWDR